MERLTMVFFHGAFLDASVSVGSQRRLLNIVAVKAFLMFVDAVGTNKKPIRRKQRYEQRFKWLDKKYCNVMLLIGADANMM